VFSSSVWLGLFTIMLVSSANNTILALSFIDLKIQVERLIDLLIGWLVD
jgi:hypothetical protein